MVSYDSVPPPVDRARRLLIVDAQDERSRILAALFRQDGYEVELLSDDSEVVAHLRRMPPDLILLDAALPDARAFEICGEVRLLDDMRLVPLVLMSEQSEEEEVVVRGLLPGADDFVALDGRLNELKARVRVQMRNRRDRELLQWAERQRARLKDAALCDALTGLANRRAGDRAVSHALDQGGPVMLLLLDVDHFKSINDTLGHATGDVVLKRIADVLARRTRKGDVVCRHGGEEFLIVIAGAPPATALQIGERYRRGVAEVRHEGALEGRPVTISIGLAVWDGQGIAPSPERLYAVADDALYGAKRGGRDRVVVSLVQNEFPTVHKIAPSDSMSPTAALAAARGAR
jgi:two-component system cell cycle response regulator